MIGRCDDYGINIVTRNQLAEVAVDANSFTDRSRFLLGIVLVDRLLTGLATKRFAFAPWVVAVVKRVDIANCYDLSVAMSEKLVEQIKASRAQSDHSKCDPLAGSRSLLVPQTRRGDNRRGCCACEERTPT